MYELESLKSIFKNRIFRIPDYQRGYAWGARQLKDFWEDLINLPNERVHYTGLLSLKKIERNIWQNWNDEQWLLEDRGFKPFHIVDGQQRLTTFVIFIQAIRELLQNIPTNKEVPEGKIYLGSYSLKDIREEFLVIEKPPQFIIRTYKFGYEMDNPSFDFLRHKILAEPDGGDIQQTFYTLNLENTKRFFADNLVSYFRLNGLAGVENLFRKLTQNLMFNVYEISEEFDVFVAFETMNNRGKKLSGLELLKNRLIYLTTLYEDQELSTDDRFALRERINSAWKEVYYQLGRNKYNPLNDDTFLNAHWIMYFHYSRSQGADYIHFLLDQKFIPQHIYSNNEVRLDAIQKYEELDEQYKLDGDEGGDNAIDQPVTTQSKLTPTEIDHYVRSLKSTAVHWYNTFNPINNPDLSAEESIWIDRLNRLGIMYFRPLVTASFLSEKTTSGDRVELMKGIERFVFLVFTLSRAQSSYRNSEFYKIARQLKNDEITIAEVISILEKRMEYLFYKLEDAQEAYFDYDYFVKHIYRRFENGYGGYYNWTGLQYLLYEYEMDKVRQRGSQKIDWKLFIKSESDKVSIEHIYPQTPGHEYWQNAFAGYDSNETYYFQGSLGNLLPLSQSINSSLQNDSFPSKVAPKFNDRGDKIRQGYSDGSHSEIEVACYTDWGPDGILERGLKLIRFMESRWNFKVESDDVRKEMLFLDFMATKNKAVQHTVVSDDV